MRSIVYQQLSGKAAKKIHERFINIFKLGKYPDPKDVLKISRETEISRFVPHESRLY